MTETTDAERLAAAELNTAVLRARLEADRHLWPELHAAPDARADYASIQDTHARRSFDRFTAAVRAALAAGGRGDLASRVPVASEHGDGTVRGDLLASYELTVRLLDEWEAEGLPEAGEPSP